MKPSLGASASIREHCDHYKRSLSSEAMSDDLIGLPPVHVLTLLLVRGHELLPDENMAQARLKNRQCLARISESS